MNFLTIHMQLAPNWLVLTWSNYMPTWELKHRVFFSSYHHDWAWISAPQSCMVTVLEAEAGYSIHIPMPFYHSIAPHLAKPRRKHGKWLSHEHSTIASARVKKAITWSGRTIPTASAPIFRDLCLKCWRREICYDCVDLDLSRLHRD